MRSARRVLAVSVAVMPASAALAAALLAAPASADANCAVMTLEPDTSGALVLVPQTVTVPAGGCVQFSNQTLFAARFTVGAYSKVVGGFSQTSGADDYPATAAGTTQSVVAREAAGTAGGSIVISAAPAPSASPTHSPSPAPRQSAPPPTTRPAPTSTPKPSSAKSAPPPPLSVTPTAAPPATSSAVALPTSTHTPFLAGQPTPATSSSAPAVVAGPLQPPTGRGAGLPAAVAALLVVGMAGALLRVLLAEPVSAVDKRRSVGAAL